MRVRLSFLLPGVGVRCVVKTVLPSTCAVCVVRLEFFGLFFEEVCSRDVLKDRGCLDTADSHQGGQMCLGTLTSISAGAMETRRAERLRVD